MKFLFSSHLFSLREIKSCTCFGIFFLNILCWLFCPKWENYFLPPSRGRSREKPIFMRFSRKYLILAPIRSHFHVCPARGSETAPFFVCGIKIDAAFRTEISALASKLMPFWLPPHLFPVGEAIYQGVFEKNLQKFCCCAGIRLLPFTFSMVESHFVPPSKRFLHLTHGWRSFCQPIRREFLLQFLTATFAAEKRHDFWKNIPTTLYRNFWTRKTTHFPKLFQKSFLLLYRKFFRSNLNPHFKIFSLLLLLGHLQS